MPTARILARILATALRHPRLIALALGALSATGFAPLSFWPVALLCIAGLMALMERVDLDDSPSSSPTPPSPSFPRKRESSASAAASHPIRAAAKRAFLIGWCFGLGHFVVGLNWIAHAFTYQDAMPHWFGYGAVLTLSLILAVYPGLAVLFLHLARVRWPALPRLPLFAALWIVSEYARATLFTGFAWNPLGMLWLGTGVDQAAQIIGTYGLSGLAVLASGALLALARRQWAVGGPILGMLGIVAILGHVEIGAQIGQPSKGPAIAITVVQPNINQNEKYDAALEQVNFAKLAELTGPSSPARPRLIFWPEAAIPAWLDMEPEWLERVAALAGPSDLLMTGGAKVYFRDRGKGFYTDRTLVGANNSAWVVTPDARLIGRYDKAHLVPYGEYLPMRNLLKPLGLSRLVPGDADFWPGPGPRSLPLPPAPNRPTLKMGVQICYEIIFSGQVIHRANRPAFLFNPSNDAWFGSWGPPQHLAQARMRAIEEAMPVIRSTPTGISAVIDSSGRIIASIPHHKAGAINTPLPAPSPPTLFSRFGNILPLAFALLLVGISLLPLVRARTSR
tara:strand:+ start:12902 stop:14596 length:1695 start_codon:yes stop_codon:yes gene_type:complete